MSTWYKLDILKNVTGPHPLSGIRQLAQAGRNFWVLGAEDKEWRPVDLLPELAPGNGNSGPNLAEESHAQYLKRCIDALIGLCKGIIADGRVDPNEVEFLHS